MYVKNEYQHSAITGKVIKSAMEVHSILGNGFQELIYHRALQSEMAMQGLSAKSEFVMRIFYKEQQIGTRRVDFLVEGIIGVEIKALTKLEEFILTRPSTN